VFDLLIFYGNFIVYDALLTHLGGGVMASIRKRGATFFVEIRRKSYPTQRKSFQSKAAASAWARRIESSMDRETWVDTRASNLTTVDGIIDNLVYSFKRFGLEIAKSKMTPLNQIKEYFQNWNIHDLTVDDVLDFAAERNAVVGPSTLQKQMYYFRQAIQVSRISLQEDVVDIAIKELVTKKIIMASVHRERRLEPGEYERLQRAAKKHKWIMLAVDLALESGMRMGEIHALKHSDIDYKKGLITLYRKDSKAIGGKRKAHIPLFSGVREVLLRGQNYFGSSGTLFHIRTAGAIGDKFAKICKEARIIDLHFHDLRHEAITRMFEVKKMSLEQVRVVSGHSSYDQLARYVNLRAKDLVGF
jgi:integrase